MVSITELRDAIDRRVTRILDVAEAMLPPPQFQAFRRLVLNEFGESGLRGELRKRRDADGSRAHDKA